MQLSGKVVLVTGASGGIGSATVRAMAARGATVVGTDRSHDDLCALLEPVGGTAIVSDARSASHADDVVRAAVEAHGRLDVVVANAGLGHLGAVDEMTADRVDMLIDVNLRAPLQLARAALPVLTAQPSSALVFVTSIAGLLLVPRESVYSATKASVEAFAEVLREEVRGTGLHVGTVVPGAVNTHFFERRGGVYDRRFPRLMTPDRVAAGIVQVVEDNAERVVLPGWLRAPMLVRRLAPRRYRTLSRRYG